MAVASAARLRQGVLVLAAILGYAAAALYGASGKSATFDEPVHITGGYSYWSLNDYRLHPENGNLAQRWLALPTAIRGAAFVTGDYRPWKVADLWTVSDAFFHRVGNDAGPLLWSARFMALIVSGALAFVVFCWSSKLFGRAGGWVSLALFAFSPTFLAHGPLATSDIFATLFFLGAAGALWTAMHQLNVRSAVLSAIAVAGLFVSKFSALIFVPIALVMLGVRLSRSANRPRDAATLGGLAVVHVAAVVLVIWASYGFRYSALGPLSQPGDGLADSWTRVTDSTSIVGRAIQVSRDTRTLPEAFLFGLGTVQTFSRTRATFLNGEVSRDGGRRLFFPYAALVKTTLPALALLAALPVLLALWRRRGDGDLYDLTPLLALIAVYWAFAISTGLNIGHRHLLPAIAATTVLLGAAGRPVADLVQSWRSSRRLIASGSLVVALLAWHAIEAIRIAPNFLAYFNPIAGGPSGAYRHLVDSSLDWGQDLPTLATWLEHNRLNQQDSTPVYLSYFGTDRPEYYGIGVQSLPSFLERGGLRLPPPLLPGVYCISATMLQAVYLGFASGAWTDEYERRYRTTGQDVATWLAAKTEGERLALARERGESFWIQTLVAYEELRFARLAARLRQREPDDHVGHSILIYRVSEGELAEALGTR